MPDTLPQRLAAAGITPADPLHPIIVELHAAAEKATLGPGAIERIAEQVSEASVNRIQAGLWRHVRMLEARTVAAGAAVLVLGIGLAFYAGWAVRAAQPVQTAVGPLSPRAVRVLQVNDLDVALDRCGSGTPVGGGRVCAPPLWLEPPPAGR